MDRFSLFQFWLLLKILQPCTPWFLQVQQFTAGKGTEWSGRWGIQAWGYEGIKGKLEMGNTLNQRRKYGPDDSVSSPSSSSSVCLCLFHSAKLDLISLPLSFSVSKFNLIPEGHSVLVLLNRLSIHMKSYTSAPSPVPGSDQILRQLDGWGCYRLNTSARFNSS